MPGKRKVYNRSTSAGKKSSGKSSGTKRLPSNYVRLEKNMIAHNVPKKIAHEKTVYLRDLNEARAEGRITEDEYFDDFYDDFYEDLYNDYDYDIDEDYSEEE